MNWTAGLDAKTGRPLDYDATKTVQDYAGLAVRYGKKAIDVRPAHYGMPTLMPNTYDPTRGLTYFNAMIGEANYFNSRPPIRRSSSPAPASARSSAAPTPRTTPSSRSSAACAIPTAR